MLCLGMYIWFVNPELPEFTCLGGHKFQFQNLAQFQSFFLAHGKMTAHDLSFQIQFASPTFRNPIFIFHLLSFCPYFQKPMTSICLNPPLLLVFIAPKLFVLTFQVCFISYFLFLFRHTSSLFLSLTVLTPLFLNFPIWLWTRLIIVSVKEFVFIMFFLS